MERLVEDLTARSRHIGALLGVLAALGLALTPASQAAASKLTVSTGAVSHVVGTTATLNGSIQPAGQAITYFFEYGPTASFGMETATGTLQAPTTPSTTPVRVALTAPDFLPGYHYELVATPLPSGTPVNGREKIYVFAPHSTALKFKLPKITTQHTIGSSIAMTGQLTGGPVPAVTHQVVLQASYYPYTATFQDVGTPVTTTLGGGFSIPVENLRQSAHYRFATVEPKPIYSTTQLVPVSVKVTLHVRTSHTPGLVRLYGNVSPAETGAHIVFQLERAPRSSQTFKTEKAEERAEERGPHFSGVFTSVVKHATRSTSRFSMVVTVRRAGWYRAFVEVKRGPLVSGYSSTVHLRAAPSSSKKKKKH
jgi:hypothetical protein